MGWFDNRWARLGALTLAVAVTVGGITLAIVGFSAQDTINVGRLVVGGALALFGWQAVSALVMGDEIRAAIDAEAEEPEAV